MRRLVLLLVAACGARTIASTPHADLAIRDVRVFDGERVLEHQTVLVERGVIAAVGDKLAIPASAKIVDGAGDTLIPGLIDAHAHVNLDTDPRTALAFGVTVEVDMMSAPEVSVGLARDDAATDHAHVIPAGYAATAPGGHGTEYGMEVPTLTKPDEAEAFVVARVKDGSHHLKIIIETGAEIGMPMPSLDAATVKALVEAAHRHHLLAVAHVGSAADVTVALDGGIDGLVHVPAQALDAATIARIAKAHVFVAPTLTVLASACGRHAHLETDPAFAPLLMPAEAKQLVAGFPKIMQKLECDAPAAIVRALRAAGVSLLAGTDAPNPGTMHGPSVHDELAHLVEAGLSPTEALVAGTSAAARAFQLPDLGVIRPGAIADLVLVTGDPTRTIAATRSIVAVWRAGVAVDRDKRRTEVTAAWKADAALRLASRDKLGLLASFDTDRDTPSVRYGKLRALSDQIAGGTSTAAVKIVDGGAAGTPRALEVSGTVVPAQGHSGWAGVSFGPSDASRQPVNMAAMRRIHFWIRGDGKPCVLFLFAGPGMPAMEDFATTKDWSEIVVDVDKLGVPLDGVIGMTWASVSPGAFAFQIDQLSFE